MLNSEIVHGDDICSNGENDSDNEQVSEVNDLSGDNKNDVSEIFGDDWLGKRGVSSESDSETAVVPHYEGITRRKRIRNQPIPSNISVIDGDVVKYKCTVCVKTFSCKSHIRYHAYCDKPKPFQCQLCSNSYSKKSVLNYHIKTHTGERPYPCLICDKSFMQLDKLKRHNKVHFGNNIECPECEAKFRDTYSLNEHKRTHTLTNLYIYKCDSCSKSFKNKSTLNKHAKGAHSNSKLFICEHCGKGFVWKYNLLCHIKTHSGVRAYSCQQCNRTFKNKNDCRKHRLTHTDAREYKCDICDGNFKRRDNLVRHLRNIHPERGSQKIVKASEISTPPSTSNESSVPCYSNRISVIKEMHVSPVTSVQHSVIKHSGSTNQVRNVSNNLRDCVIKSTTR